MMRVGMTRGYWSMSLVTLKPKGCAIRLSKKRSMAVETQDICIKAVEKYSILLEFVSGLFKTKTMLKKAVEDDQESLEFVPDHFKTQGMCNEAIEVSPWQLKYVPDQYKMQRMCDKAVRGDSSTLQFISDWFVTQQQMYVWYDDDYCFHDDEIIEWYGGKAQKTKGSKRLNKRRTFTYYLAS